MRIEPRIIRKYRGRRRWEDRVHCVRCVQGGGSTCMHVTGGRRLQWHAVAPQAVPAALSVHTGRATPAAATAGRGPGRCCSPRRGSGVMGGRHASGRVWGGANANAGACHWQWGATTQSRTQCRAARRARRAGILRGRASLARIQPCSPWGSGARGRISGSATLARCHGRRAGALFRHELE